MTYSSLEDPKVSLSGCLVPKSSSRVGIRIFRLSSLHSTIESAARDSRPIAEPLGSLDLQSHPIWLRFAYGDEKLIIATATSIHVCSTSSVLSGSIASVSVISSGLPSPILDIIPNPAAVGADGLAKHVAILGKEGIMMLDVENNALGAAFGGSTTSGVFSGAFSACIESR